MAKLNDDDLIKAVMAARDEADDARQSRLATNRENWAAYFGSQNFSEKIAGQSQSVLPKTLIVAEKFVGTLERALVSSPDFYRVEYLPNLSGESGQMALLAQALMASGANIEPQPEEFLSESAAKRLIDYFVVDELKTNARSGRGLPSLFAAGCKLAALEAVAAFKVLPQPTPAPWRLRIDLVGLESLFLDPTEELFLIHSYEADWHEVLRSAESGWFDEKAVRTLGEEHQRSEDTRKAADRGQDEVTRPSWRHRVVIDEYWGTVLNTKGEVVHENVVCAVGNGRTVIKKPVAYDYWPWTLIRPCPVPFSTYGRGLFDETAQINFALNELFNLVTDAGISSVWGVKQLHKDFLEDENQVSDGIVPGDTLIVSSNMPMGEKVLEVVASGEVPRDAMTLWSKLDSELAQSASATELSLGQLPAKEIRATEAVQLQQQQAATFTVLAARLERDVLAPLLETAFRVLISNADQLDPKELADIVGSEAARKLQNTPTETLTEIFGPADINVKGLSAMGERTQDFAKLQQFLQVSAATILPLAQVLPALGIDPKKLLERVVRTLGIDMESISLPKGAETPLPQPEQAQGSQPAPVSMPTPGQ